MGIFDIISNKTIDKEAAMIEQELRKCELFKNMSSEDVNCCLTCANAKVHQYGKDEMIFRQTELPTMLYLLIDGDVIVGKDNMAGRRNIIFHIQDRDIFGEMYLFINEISYDYYAVTTAKSNVLEIPRDFFYKTCAKSCGHHSSLIFNMLSILARKAFILNTKVQLLSSGSLRQKIARYLMDECKNCNYVLLGMNREELADYLNVTRPSLSRELIKMQEEGLINFEKNKIDILDFQQLNDYL